MKPRITDHALVRWLERVEGVDIEVLREDIAERVKDIFATKPHLAPYEDVWLVFKNDALITVTPDRPRVMNHAKHNLEPVNGTHVGTVRLPWQAHKRKRRK